MNRYKSIYTIAYSAVMDAFEASGIRSDPLLYPAHEIERILKEQYYLSPTEHLGEYNEDKESFSVYNLSPTKITWRTKIARWLLSK